MKKTFIEWASSAGHVRVLPPPGRPRADYVQSGPNFRVVKAHTGFPDNQILTEDQYKTAVAATYQIEIR